MHLHPADTTPAITKSNDPPNIAKQNDTCKDRTPLSLIAGAVDISYALHNQINGSTVSLIHGSMAGQKLYSVSIYPERRIELWESPTRQELFDFAQANAELLLKPRHALGTGYDDWNQVHVLDVVILDPNRDAALALALRYGQIAIFDLGSRREIPVSRPSEILLAGHAGGVNA
jgi:hypothetical protein